MLQPGRLVAVGEMHASMGDGDCDAGIAQACKPAPHFGTIARFSIPKIDATPAPFSA
jgi:hypothetical protein